jgi:hypothetical protein
MLPEEDSARGFSCMMIIGIVFWTVVAVLAWRLTHG